jgi:hypothetical protein
MNNTPSVLPQSLVDVFDGVVGALFGSVGTAEHTCTVGDSHVQFVVECTDEEMVIITLYIDGMDDSPRQLTKTTHDEVRCLAESLVSHLGGLLYGEPARGPPLVAVADAAKPQVYRASTSLRTCEPVAGPVYQ